MTAMPSTCWCLRFLSGAARGGTIALDRGENLVGSGSDCRVLLAGSDAHPRHLIVHVGELAVALQRIGDAPVRLNGDEVTQRRRSLVPGDEIKVGSFRLQLNRSYAPLATTTDTGFAESILCEDAQLLDTLRPAPRRSGTDRRAAVLVMMCASLALAGWAAWPGAQDRADAPRGPDAAAVQRALAGFSEVEVVTLPGGQFMVRGYVETRTRRQALQSAVEPLGRRVGVSVHAVDEVVEQARRYVGNSAISLSYQGQGRIVLSGVSDDPALRKRIRQLGEDLQPAVLVTDRVRYRDDALARDGSRRAPSEAAQAAQAAQSAQWAAWQAELPARIVGVTDDGNGTRYIQLANGSRYYEGSVLRSGTRLDRIDGSHLQLGTGRDDVAR
jgi:type III secretion system YscD/HrpQ family protein